MNWFWRGADNGVATLARALQTGSPPGVTTAVVDTSLRVYRSGLVRQPPDISESESVVRIARCAGHTVAMKTILTFCALLFSAAMFAAEPVGFNYTAIGEVSPGRLLYIHDAPKLRTLYMDVERINP